MAGTPSISIGTSRPCQCTVCGSGRRFSKRTRTRSPSVTSIVGPGMLPLYPQTSKSLPGTNSAFTGSATSRNTLTPLSSSYGSFGTSSTFTGTLGPAALAVGAAPRACPATGWASCPACCASALPAQVAPSKPAAAASAPWRKFRLRTVIVALLSILWECLVCGPARGRRHVAGRRRLAYGHVEGRVQPPAQEHPLQKRSRAPQLDEGLRVLGA